VVGRLPVTTWQCSPCPDKREFWLEETAMKVIKPQSVTVAIRTLCEEDRRKIIAWFDHLGNWEHDEHVQKLSKKTSEKDVYVLNTSDDLRIFFQLDIPKQEIVIVDIAKPSRFKNVPVAWSHA
jgi:mRNA-degrading endonuclease RelE of RelBE toxin-antitoxin system